MLVARPSWAQAREVLTAPAGAEATASVVGIVRLFKPLSAGGEADASTQNFLKTADRVRPDRRLKTLRRLQNATELGLRDMQQLQGWSALPGQVADEPDWPTGTEALFAAPRLRAFQHPAQHVRQQSRFYEHLVTLLGANP